LTIGYCFGAGAGVVVPVFLVLGFLVLAFFVAVFLVSVCANANVVVPAINPSPRASVIIFFIEVFLLVVSGGYSRLHCQS
jgi:uncharacterized membrane protein YjgN (DUF898 family)